MMCAPLKRYSLLFSNKDLDNIDVLGVASNQLIVFAVQSKNKYSYLIYHFCFRGNTHIILLDTGADFTMISQLFFNQHQLNCIVSKVRSV